MEVIKWIILQKFICECICKDSRPSAIAQKVTKELQCSKTFYCS